MPRITRLGVVDNADLHIHHFRQFCINTDLKDRIPVIRLPTLMHFFLKNFKLRHEIPKKIDGI
jgi:hypothetical protein